MAIYGYIWPYMAIYRHILLYMDIYVTIYCYILYFKCLYLYLGVWTCIWVSELVFWVSGLVFGCLDLIFECLDLYSGYCIPVGCLYTCRMWLWRVRSPPQPPRGLCACRRRFFFLKNDAPGIFEHVDCGFCRFSWIWGPPGLFVKKWAIWSNDYAS